MLLLKAALLLHVVAGSESKTNTRRNTTRHTSTTCAELTAVPLSNSSAILSATTNATQNGVQYCLVKVLVQPAINIFVGLPSNGSYNNRFMALGGGGYAGTVGPPEQAVDAGYVGATTDTGHVGTDGSFGMLSKGVPNTPLQIDFAYRSEHMMAVVSKRLIVAFYGKAPEFSYWNGCSTGGRQGLMLAQRFPEDYDGIVAGAPAIHWDKFQAYQIWPQMAMFLETGSAIPTNKTELATSAAVQACDGLDGVIDGVIRDPRACHYDAHTLQCTGGAQNTSCLTHGEATAINKIWDGSRNASGALLWYGVKRGADLSGLAGLQPFPISVAQPRYWVYLEPAWDWHFLVDYSNYQAFFDKTIQMVGPIMGTDGADLRPFRARGGKLVMWHGWADQLIMPQGSIDYYDAVVSTVGKGNLSDVQQFARLFMAPGVGHCGGGAGPAPQRMTTPLEAVRQWVEDGVAPDTLLAQKRLPCGKIQTRPLCPHPQVAIWTGKGSTDDAANFACDVGGVIDTEDADKRGNERNFGIPFFPVSDAQNGGF